jgi:lysine-N-methylase
MPLPTRPRLAEHAFARRYRAGDVERVVLHDRQTGELVEIGPREWVILSCADGTRDLDGLLLAAGREGAVVDLPAIRSFLDLLDGAGMLAEGTGRRPGLRADEPASAPAPAHRASVAHAGPDDEPVDPARPVEALPGYTLACDGSGSCCRIYASVIFGPAEAALARGLLPRVEDGGARHELVFMPEHGSAPSGGAAVAMRDGRCVYLAGNGRCGLHAIGGPAAKPVGCNTFPTSFVDDGETVRASVSVECACVLASVGREGGDPLVPPGVRARADLDPVVRVATLPREVCVAPGATVARAAFVAWSRRLAAADPGGDVATFLWRLAEAVTAVGIGDAAIARAAQGAARPDEAAIVPWIESLLRRARQLEKRDARWRSRADLAYRAARWVGAACEALLAPGAVAAVAEAPLAPEGEAFYLRAIVHGHRLVGELPVVTALRDRAVRLLVARALGLVLLAEDPSALDPACAEPLALVEAMLRGHGLDAYAHDFAGPREGACASPS